MERGHQTKVVWSKTFLLLSLNASSEALELKPILLCSVIKCLVGFPMTSNDLEMPFSVKICFLREFG